MLVRFPENSFVGGVRMRGNVLELNSSKARKWRYFRHARE